MKIDKILVKRSMQIIPDNFYMLLATAFLGISIISGQTKNTDGILEFNNLAYHKGTSVPTDSLQKLNLVIPNNVEEPPLLVWIGGGAWSYVNKDMEMDLAKKIAVKGIAVASVGHRLSPATWKDPKLNKGVQHPKHAQDVALALKWLYDHAKDYGYDKSRIFIGGYSSGAHLAALVTLDTSYLEAQKLSKQLIRGTIAISGAYDIQNYYEVFKSGNHPEWAELHVAAVFGKSQEDYKKASPTHYLQNLSSPLLLMTDNSIPHYTEGFEEAIQATGFKNYKTVYVPDLSHGELWRHLSFEKDSDYRETIVAFIKAHALNH